MIPDPEKKGQDGSSSESRKAKDESDDEGLSQLALAYRNAGPYLHLGWTLAASLALFTYGGFTLDNHLGSKPWFTLIGALLGIAGGMLELFRIVGRLK